MKLRMKQTQRGSADGVTVVTYEAGKVYELADTARALDLARVFVSEGWAEDLSAAAPQGGQAGASEPRGQPSDPSMKPGRRR